MNCERRSWKRPVWCARSNRSTSSSPKDAPKSCSCSSRSTRKTLRKLLVCSAVNVHILVLCTSVQFLQFISYKYSSYSSCAAPMLFSLQLLIQYECSLLYCTMYTVHVYKYYKYWRTLMGRPIRPIYCTLVQYPSLCSGTASHSHLASSQRSLTEFRFISQSCVAAFRDISLSPESSFHEFSHSSSESSELLALSSHLSVSSRLLLFTFAGDPSIPLYAVFL